MSEKVFVFCFVFARMHIDLCTAHAHFVDGVGLPLCRSSEGGRVTMDTKVLVLLGIITAVLILAYGVDDSEAQ